ncbi:MAG: hypothetical protein PHP43_10335, partial [Methanoculleus sp.]|nr:hypothetical protein [Methanoculleus sp.]
MGNWKPAAAVALGCLVIAAIIGTALASDETGAEAWGDLRKFGSKEEIEAFLKENAQGGGNGSGYPQTTGGVAPEAV